MKPDNNTTNQPGMDLPAPISPEVQPQRETESIVVKQGTERNPELLPIVPAATTQQPPQPVSDNRLPQATSNAVNQADKSKPTAGSSPSTPPIADDLDLIEKEWVNKAKEIVSQTRDDPHKQNEEISMVKADYIKKRYNKEVPKS